MCNPLVPLIDMPYKTKLVITRISYLFHFINAPTLVFKMNFYNTAPPISSIPSFVHLQDKDYNPSYPEMLTSTPLVYLLTMKLNINYSLQIQQICQVTYVLVSFVVHSFLEVEN
jgi:hypothetical protein